MGEHPLKRPAQPPLTAKRLDGALDHVTRHQVAGWARRTPGPHPPVSLCILVDGQPVATITADQARQDLVESGIGAHAFTFHFATPLSAGAHTVSVCAAGSNVHLVGSPRLLAANLDGNIDQATRERVSGWALDPADPDTPISLVVEVDGVVAGRVLANTLRDDLVRHGIGTGRHSFAFVFEPPLSPLRHRVRLTCEASGASMPGSPCVIEAARVFDAEAQKSIAALLDSYDSDAGLTERLTFLSAEVARLLLLKSDRRSRRGERLAAQQFRRRWASPADHAQTVAALPRRALIIDATMPDIGRDAGSVAIVSHALSLQRLGFEVVLAAADMEAGGAAALETLGIACCHAPWFASIEEVLRAQAATMDLIYLHRVSTAFPYIALTRRYAPRARVLYSVADLHHLRLYRQSIAEQRPELQVLAKHVRAQELWSANQADAVITHSEPEAAILRQAAPALHPHVIPWTIRPRPGAATFAQRRGLAFIGNYTHTPNLDSALFLVDEIMPLVLQGDPSLECHLAGSAMPATLRRPRPGVVVQGWVDDLPALLDTVRLTVAPLTYGAGLKGKVLESLAAGTPCVCTPVAAEGIVLGPALSSLVATSAAAFAASILRLHTTPTLHADCVREGLDIIARSFGAERIDRLMKAAIGEG